MRHLVPQEPTGQLRVAMVIGHIGELLAGHANPRGLGPLQPINEIPFIIEHRGLHLISADAQERA